MHLNELYSPRPRLKYPHLWLCRLPSVGLWNCPFNVECGCPFKLRRIRHADASLGSYVYSLEFSNVAHVDHEIPLQRDLQRKQLSRQTKALMDSPTKLRAGPRALVSSMRSQVQLSSHEAELVKRERVRLIKWVHLTLCINSLHSSFNSLHSSFNSYIWFVFRKKEEELIPSEFRRKGLGFRV